MKKRTFTEPFPILVLLLGLLLFQPSRAMAQELCYVDLIIAYTPEASEEAGGDAILVEQIKNAVLEMNTAFMNSHVNHWVRLVRTVKVNYNESGCFLEDLNAFWKGTDSALSMVHTIRQRYHADLAALVITNTQFCGLPVSDSSVATPSTAFCAIQYDCMKHNLSLPHMFGHLYGCGHAMFELDSANQGSAFPYGHGYHWYYNDCANFYTIMGVTDNVNCFGQGAYDCNLIPYFSNPDISFLGVLTGNHYANNVRVLNDNAPLLAGFLPLPGNYTLTDTVRTADLGMNLALNKLSTGAGFLGTDSSSVFFVAGEQILLLPGFTIQEGAYFETVIDSTLSNCNLPNAIRALPENKATKPSGRLNLPEN